MSTAVLERPCNCSPSAVLGQKVKVMEGVTNAGAGGQRVHVAEGVGNWALGRSSQTVHIRPDLTPCDCGITDTFSREVDIDHLWGSLPLTPADCGVEWVVTDGNVGSTLSWEANVTGGYGRLWTEANPGSGNGADPRASLPFIGIDQTFVAAFRVKFVSFNTSLESQNVSFSVLTDAGNALLTFTMGDGIYLVSDGTSGAVRLDFVPTTDAWYNVRFEQDADTELRVKVWLASTSEPGSWTLTRDVSGQTAWSGSSQFRIDLDQVNGTVAEALEVHLDDLDIDGVDRCMFDNFKRTETGTWGTATPSGYAWTSDNESYLSVAAGLGVVSVPGFGGVDIDTTEAGSAWWRAGEFTLTAKFKIDTVDAAGCALGFFVFADGAGPEIGLYSGGGQYLSINGIAFADPIPDAFTVDTFYIVKWHHAASLDQAKVWLATGTEPVSWMVSDTSEPLDLGDTLRVYVNNGAASADKVVSIEYIEINLCPVPAPPPTN